MSLPAALITVPVVGTFTDRFGTPYAGSVSAYASIDSLEVPGTGGAQGQFLTLPTTENDPQVFAAILDGNGSFSLPLWSTDNSKTNPTGWQWTVLVYLTNGPAQPKRWVISVPGSVGSVDLTTIPESSEPATSGASAYVTQAALAAAVTAAQNGTAATQSWVDSEIDTKINNYDATLVGSAPAGYATIHDLASKLQADELTINQNATALAGKAPKLTPTSSVLSAAAVLGAGDLARADTTNGAFTLTLPTAPPDGTVCGAQLIGSSSAHALTIAAGGTDVIESWGSTAATYLVNRPGQRARFEYDAALTQWLAYDAMSQSDLFAYLTAQFAPAINSPNYVSVGSAFKLLLAESGAAITAGMDLRPNGIRAEVAFTIAGFGIEQDTPANGSQVWQLVAFHTTTEMTTVIATVTVPALTRGAVVNGLSYAVAATDRLLVQNVSAAGTYLGEGVTASVALGTGATLTLPSAPATPTGFSATTASSTTVNLAWGTTAGATNYLVLVDGVPTVVTATTNYTATIASGSTHTFAVAAMCPGAMSAATTALSAGAYQSSAYWNQTDGAPSGCTTQLGGTANGQSVTVTSDQCAMTSGNLGGATVSDDVGLQFNVDGNTHTLYDLTGQRKFNTFNCISDIHLSADAMTSAFSLTNGIQVEFTGSQGRIGMKTPTTNSGNFETLVAYTNYPITVATGTYYGWRIVVAKNADGTGSIKFYFGTAAQQQSGTLPLFLSAALDAAHVSALTAGYVWIRQLGNQTTSPVTPETETSTWQFVTITPQSAAGT